MKNLFTKGAALALAFAGHGALTKLLTLTAAIACVAAGNSQAQVIIYDADFVTTVSIDHTDTGNNIESSPQVGGNFSIGYTGTPNSDSTLNFFETTGTSLISSDFGGNHFMRSIIIDVSAWNEVDIDVLADFVGSASFNNSPTEFIEYYYTLDGGSEQQFFFFTDDPNGSNLNASLTLLDVSANSNMTVGLNANVDGAGDGFEITSFTVTGITPVPEPSSGLVVLAVALGMILLRRRKV